ncbi:hypothetical protein LCGC14_2928630, partial [marine sediment metagenome]
MPHPCALIEEGMQGFEACQVTKMTYAADKVLGEAPLESVTTLKEALVDNAPVITAHINAALSKVGQWVEWTEDLAAEQAPLLVQEIIYWGIADAGFGIGLGILFLLALPVTLWYLSRSKTMPEGKKCMGAIFEGEGSGFDSTYALVGGIFLPLIGFIV